MAEFAWDPDSYLSLMAEEIADFAGLQQALVGATADVAADDVLDLGCGSGETARRVLDTHPQARLTGVDANAGMLAAAARTLTPDRVTLVRRRLQDPLPGGPFDLAVSALAVHHLEGSAKADLFARVASVLRPGGRLVLADLVVPDHAEEAFTEVDWVDDVPSTAQEQLDWLNSVGFLACVTWSYRDLAVIVAERATEPGIAR